ncbi:methyltransferase domain-containing protein [Streptomyces sp. NBC_01381]|uniref:class I SAM-dependent methyltransferase n=1 Tax=Streptomyces sp. NBC_01381 TaxID=2903845 RepID=UPI00225075FE|nr:methyltransferase domain-containing protein [Streptomyces sp. NBC_01381]MCX4666482.1 methyltransferase domain-containing protein [Streptomyces sp. NBC_01381]
MNVDEIQHEALELGPWVNRFEFDGRTYPRLDHAQTAEEESAAPPRKGRAQAFFDVFPDAKQILELGALEGADTVRLACRPGTSVLAVEGRADNLSRGEFITGLHQLANVEWMCADVETLDFEALGTFDAVLCAGLLYHLQEPWRHLREIAKITDRLFISTHYWGGTGTMAGPDGHTVKLVHEEHPEPRTRALTETVLWFDRESLLQAIRDAGFDGMNILHDVQTDTVCDMIVACHRTSPSRDNTSA